MRWIAVTVVIAILIIAGYRRLGVSWKTIYPYLLVALLAYLMGFIDADMTRQ